MTRDARLSAQSATTRGADPNGILASIGLVPYDWRPKSSFWQQLRGEKVAMAPTAVPVIAGAEVGG